VFGPWITWKLTSMGPAIPGKLGCRGLNRDSSGTSTWDHFSTQCEGRAFVQRHVLHGPWQIGPEILPTLLSFAEFIVTQHLLCRELRALGE
jgi:hypothetical protein